VPFFNKLSWKRIIPAEGPEEQSSHGRRIVICVSYHLSKDIGGKMLSDRRDRSQDPQGEARVELRDGSLQESKVVLDVFERATN
jgi:hypothetical protein